MKKQETKVVQPVNVQCTHPNIVPYLSQSGKRVFIGEEQRNEFRQNIYKEKIRGSNYYIDWTSNVINGHYVKVIKYWCPTCNIFIEPPNYLGDPNANPKLGSSQNDSE